MPIQVMADDSGYRGQSPVFVIGGLIGQAQAWTEFSEKWTQCLNEPPKLTMFKMRDAPHRTGVFRGFSKTERNAKMEKLVRIIDEFGFDALSVTVDIEAYANIAGNTSDIATKPYFFAFNHFLKAACADALDREAKQPIEIFFDEHKSLGERTKRWYPMLRRMWERSDPMCYKFLPVEPRFEDDETFLPLQAADFVAWFQRRVNSADAPHEFDWLNEVIKNIGVSRHSRWFGQSQFGWQFTFRKPHADARTTPTRGPCSRSRSTQNLWIVVRFTSAAFSPSWSRRAAISSAALLVKVNAQMRSGATPCAAMRK